MNGFRCTKRPLRRLAWLMTRTTIMTGTHRDCKPKLRRTLDYCLASGLGTVVVALLLAVKQPTWASYSEMKA